MKRILSFLCTALVACSMTAASISAADGQVWWGTTTGSTSTIKFEGIGSGVTGTHDLAVFFPGDHFFLEGKKLCAVRLYVPNISASDLDDNVKIWVSKKLPSNVSKADIVCIDTLYSKLSKGRFNDIALPEAYTITEEGYYVGMSMNITGLTSSNAKTPFAYINPVSNPKSFTRVSGTMPNWTDRSDALTFPMMCLLEGEFPSSAARAVSVGSSKTVINTENLRTTFRVENNSPKGITSLNYTVTDIDGNVSEPRSVKFSTALRVMGQGMLNIILPPSAHAGTHHPRVTITQVNSGDNFITGEDTYADGFQIVLSENATKRVVEEEFTGTWCGWCPRGMVGLEMAEKQFGENFIGIAVHSGDIMDASSASGYNAVLNYVPGFPACFLDRNYDYNCDPYTGSKGTAFGIKSDIDTFLKNITEADIYVHPTWTDDTKKKIEISSYVYFKMDSPEQAPYAVGYVLTADSLHGTGGNWSQSNYYAGSSGDANLSKFASGTSVMTGLYYNHVAIAGAGVNGGIKNSISLPIQANAMQRHTYTMTIPTSSSLVQDKKNLHVVALLFDTSTGQILNAHKSEIFDMATGIEASEADIASQREVGRYNLQGQRILTPTPGVNIVKFADGHSEKVLVK
ncbi:MAG: thioredoxin family protein [Alloprevotella sp.]|nr:thioredoxin family protein [Alloprevotella sp.]